MVARQAQPSRTATTAGTREGSSGMEIVSSWTRAYARFIGRALRGTIHARHVQARTSHTLPPCHEVRRRSFRLRRSAVDFAPNVRGQGAAAVGLTPEELRRRNFIQRGETTATGQVIREDVDLDGLLDRAFELTDYQQKRERFASENEGARIKRGIGFASFMHGAGFTGSGEKYLQSIVGCEATRRRLRGSLRAPRWAGDEDRLRADRGRRPGDRLRDGRCRPARHGRRAQQRPHGRLAHDDDRRQARRDSRASG